MNASLELSYRFCEQLARRSGSSFFLAFRALPQPMFRQMCVLYAFMRHTDDLGDQPGLSLVDRRNQLRDWQLELSAALQGEAVRHPVLPALAEVARLRQIPERDLVEVIHGVQGDLEPRTFASFPQLEHYCYQVAGVVGLCCLKIWGFEGEEPVAPALACGTAFQLTNILRDLKEDAELGRCYLPVDDMQTAGYSIEMLRSGVRNSAFQTLMQQQADRAWSYYQQAWSLQSALTPPGRRMFRACFELYSSLLREIERSGFDVLSRRIRLSRWHQARIAMQCLLRLEPRRPRLVIPREKSATLGSGPNC